MLGSAEFHGGKWHLTPRRTEILFLLTFGHTEKSIADRLGITRDTVKRHTLHARWALRAKTTTQAVATALRIGAIP